jgi:hypothetical protein
MKLSNPQKVVIEQKMLRPGVALVAIQPHNPSAPEFGSLAD